MNDPSPSDRSDASADPPVASDRLLFVGGLHRSGTTPVARLIESHPDASGLRGTGKPEDEGQHLQDVYPRARLLGGPGRFGFDPRSRLSERDLPDDPAARAAIAARLLRAWIPFWDLRRRLLVEKSPPDMLRTRYLHGLFPGARILVVVRHPVATSLATRKWSGTSVESLIEHWLVCHEALAEDLALGGGVERAVRVVRYEELARDPRGVLAEIEAWLGLPPRTGVAADAALEFRPDGNDAYFRRHRAERASGEFAEDWARAEARFSERARAAGYDLAAPVAS